MLLCRSSVLTLISVYLSSIYLVLAVENFLECTVSQKQSENESVNTICWGRQTTHMFVPVVCKK